MNTVRTTRVAVAAKGDGWRLEVVEGVDGDEVWDAAHFFVGDELLIARHGDSAEEALAKLQTDHRRYLTAFAASAAAVYLTKIPT